MTDIHMSSSFRDFELSEFEQELLASYPVTRAAVAEVAEVTAVKKYTYYRPFLGNWHITQWPHTGHWALDWGMPNGTKLYCPFPSGVVSFAGYTSDGYAYNLRIVDSAQGLMCVLAHMPKDKPFKVKVGQAVSYETHVGFSNNTGYSTGPHLHFEIRVRPWAYANCYQSVYTDLDLRPTTPPPAPPPSTGGEIAVKTRQPCKVFAAPSKGAAVVKRLILSGYRLGVVEHNAEWAQIVSGKQVSSGYIRWAMLRRI